MSDLASRPESPQPSLVTAKPARSGNGKTVTLVLSVVLGATTLIATTLGIVGWSEARKATKVERDLSDFRKQDYQPWKEEQKELKGQILQQLRNLSESQKEIKDLLMDHMQLRHK